MKNEVDKNLSKIYFTSDKHNPYFTKDDKTLPEDHPKRIFSVRQSGYLNSNELKIESDLNTFYDLKHSILIKKKKYGILNSILMIINVQLN